MNRNKRWTTENIPDQTGKVVIVTGSSSGIGKETARVLANKNATVIIAVRNMSKGQAVADEIVKANANADVSVRELDLSSLKSIRTFAEKFNSDYKQLDLLINNAGVMIPPYSKTEDGFELQFGTNHLGHFALTGLLLDLMKQIPNSRIVNVASVGHRYGNLDFDDLNWETRKYNPMRSYGDSKIANLYFTYELQRRLAQNDSSPIVTAAHPGWTGTDLQRHSGPMQFLNRFFAMPTEQGALPTLRAAIDDQAQGGDYFGPSGFMEWNGYPVKVSSNKRSHDKTIASKLWDVSEALTDIRYNLN